MTDNVTPVWEFCCNPNDKYPKRQEVNSAAISDDGNLVVAGTFYHDYSDSKHRPRDPSPSDFFMYCFERNQAALDDPQPKYKWKQRSQEGVYWVDISGDSALVAGGGSNFVVAYRTSDGAQVLSTLTGSRVNELVLSNDGTWLAVASDQLYLFRFDGERYERTSTFKPPNAAYSVSMSSDGQRIAFSDFGPYHDEGAKAQVFLFSNDQGALSEEKTFTEAESYSHCVHMSNGGKYFAAGGMTSGHSNPGRVYFFESSEFAKTGRWTWKFDVSGIVYNLFVDDQGRVAAVCNDGADAGFVLLLKAGEQIWKRRVERNPNSTIMAEEYVTVSTGHPNGTPSYFYLLSVLTGETIWRYEVPLDMSWPMAICNNATGIVAGSDNQQIFYFRP